MTESRYLGIDLGTSNSAVAVFEGGRVRPVFDPMGDISTPSVVRVTPSGIVVGRKAQRKLFDDPENTFKEFKRLMGTNTLAGPDRNGQQWSPVELSAEVLKALKRSAEESCDATFDKVVVTLPALFELPQSHATANAARIAGFQSVELLPEPVASGLAAGWDQEEKGAWLVYDLGGGTFDVSLLESREGLLRVVGHDGDNFLGGRDIDRAMTEWVRQKLSDSYRLELDDGHGDFKPAIRHIQSAVEAAKIRLSTADSTLIELEFEYDGQEVALDQSISRHDLETLSQDIIQKTIHICQRLVKSKGLQPDQILKVVLVGGPAHMPMVGAQVEQHLAPIAKSDIDPMALVAEGAALYAATIGLACHGERESAKPRQSALWLQHPTVCSDLNPNLLGRVLDETMALTSIRATETQSGWQSDKVPIEDNLFVIELTIRAGQRNRFMLEGFDQRGNRVDIGEPGFEVTHGISMSDPPLSRSIGLALADGSTRRFIERGTPLPAKRTFVQHSAESLAPRGEGRLTIPIVQGERNKSRFCRQVGELVLTSSDIKRTVQVGAPIEITIEVDRGGDLKAQAFLMDQNVLIEGVAQLAMGDPSPESLRALCQSLAVRINNHFQAMFRERDEKMIARMEPLSQQIQLAQRALPELESDADSRLRIHRSLIEIEVELEQIENEDQIENLIEECQSRYVEVSYQVESQGDPTDRRLLQDLGARMGRATERGRQSEIEKVIEGLESLQASVHRKSPAFWKDAFDYWASFIGQAQNQRRARAIVSEGRQAIADNNMAKLESLTRELASLIPRKHLGGGQDPHDSGVY